MPARRLACVDANGDLLGYIICDSDEAYEQTVKKITETMNLPDQRPGDLPSLEELKAREEQQ